MQTVKKEKKRSLRAILLILLIVAVILIGSTYAWFISNTQVSINTIDVRIDTVEGLEISADAVTYKIGLSNDDINNAKNTYEDATNQMPTKIIPVSTIGKIDNSTGRQSMFVGTTTKSGNDGVLTTVSEVETNRQGGSFIAFELFLKLSASQEKTLYLDKSSNVIWKKDGENDKDKGLQNAARVAFIAINNDPTGGVSTSQGLQYSQAKSWQKIWEPNCLSHEAYAAAEAERYGKTLTSSTAMSYEGVMAETTSGIDINKLTSTNYPTIFSNVANVVATPSTIDSNVELGKIQPGVTKVKVYMWLEGQDVDCFTQASGTSFSFNIKFSITPV